MRLLGRAAAALIAMGACGDDGAKVADCTVACAADEDCPGGLRCSAQHLCSARGAGCPVTCTSGQFDLCTDATHARSCNADGDGFTVADCGPAGCNEDAMRCNACAPGSARCSPGDIRQLETCDADGAAYAAPETCSVQCLASPAAHCAYLTPPYDVLTAECDTPAASGSLVVSSDTTFDSNVCPGVVHAQINGPDICVVRPASISIAARIKLTGARAFAFIADGNIAIDGAIDASADGVVDGPGGGTRISGAAPIGAIGGGGAGFRTGGGDGGGGGAGGAVGAVPGFLGALRGGYRAASALGGGGGGALLLVSCRGAITIDGPIDVGGGGGAVGSAAGGGGSGGVLVVAGLGVGITGGAHVYANGGSGGGATEAGADGSLSSTVGSAGGGGTGGAGGVRLAPPGSGTAGGGGGGSTGYILVYTPASATPVLSPGDVSPAITAGHLPLR